VKEQHTSGYENFVHHFPCQDKGMMRVTLARNISIFCMNKDWIFVAEAEALLISVLYMSLTLTVGRVGHCRLIHGCLLLGELAHICPHRDAPLMLSCSLV
jgi:hypothetical protein